MAQSIETSGFTFLDSNSDSEKCPPDTVSCPPDTESCPPDEYCPQQPTPTPRASKQDQDLTSASDQLVLLDNLYDEQERACSYEEYKQVLLCEDKERKDISTIQSIPQLMKDTLFFQNEEMLASSQERVKHNSSNDEEFKSFVKYLENVLKHQKDQTQREKARKLLDILKSASLIANNGQTSLKSSNKVFEKLSPVFQEANNFCVDQVGVSYLPFDLLREANQCSKQRQQYLQHGELDAAEKCLNDAMDKIEVSVARAEIQKQDTEKRYMEVAVTNRHIGVQETEQVITEAINTDKNTINLLQSHCYEDLQRMERAVNTLDRVHNKSKQHYKQLDELQIKELENNKIEQEQLEARLKLLRDNAKGIKKQREYASKHDKASDKMFTESLEKVLDWQEKINRLQTQTQHANSVLSLVQECSHIVTEDFYQVHQQYLSDLNTLAVESLQLYRKCLVGRIVACKFRNQELETNISALSQLLVPKKEELKKQLKTGLKVLSDKTAKEVNELGEYKLSYTVSKQSLEELLVESYNKLEGVDIAIMKRVPDAKLESVDAVYEEERNLQDAEWDNLEMQSITKAYH